MDDCWHLCFLTCLCWGGRGKPAGHTWGCVSACFGSRFCDNGFNCRCILIRFQLVSSVCKKRCQRVHAWSCTNGWPARAPTRNVGVFPKSRGVVYRSKQQKCHQLENARISKSVLSKKRQSVLSIFALHTTKRSKTDKRDRDAICIAALAGLPCQMLIKKIENCTIRPRHR